ncbi:MAG: RNA 2'-phosphotransferase [Pelagimonas sp.]|uniref:RNA 2'-phosphotransferase n=1 Tax=Pelagimonas sp. TaxID=2073170 RepID=UPI003D6C2136
MPSTPKAISKFLSYVLRHDPASIGLTLDRGGWAEVQALIDRATLPLTQSDIETVVATSDKQRFALSEDGKRIRANQGHSIDVDLGLKPIAPPDRLFHGTAQTSLTAILAQGLTAQSRHHVHLSPDPDTARTVGMRHGSPVVLVIDAAAMHAAGYVFFKSQNGVWLSDHVPPTFLSPR